MSNAATATPMNQPIEYPESDGQPMGETDVHVDALAETLKILKAHFARDPQVYVAGDNMFYFEEGNPRACVSPDIYVVKGIAKGLRRIYKLWEEGKAPDFVLEISSRKTRREDLGKKRATYAELGVGEYLLFDPTEDYLKPPLQLYRLGAGGEYQRVLPRADGAAHVQSLGLLFRAEGFRLRLVDAETGEALLNLEETQGALAQAEAAARQADARAEALAAELDRLRAQLKG